MQLHSRKPWGKELIFIVCGYNSLNSRTSSFLTPVIALSEIIKRNLKMKSNTQGQLGCREIGIPVYMW